MSAVHKELRELYQEVILDHNKRPQNFRALEGEAVQRAEGDNPLCGDKVTVYLRLEGDRVAEATFQGAGCAISQASASLMTEALQGKTRDEVQALFKVFTAKMKGEPTPADAPDLGKLAALEGVREYPMRVKCATLAWHTLQAALNSGTGDAGGGGQSVSTEA